MIEKFRDWCDKHFDKYMPKLENGEWKYEGSFGYYAQFILYYILQIMLFMLFGKMLNILNFIIVGSIVYNSITIFSYSFHCKNLDHCIIATQIIFSIFGIISKTAHIWVVFLLCLYSCIDIYKKAPIELNVEHEGKDEDWHFKRVVLIMTIYMAISLITYYFGLEQLCKCVLLSLVMTDLLLFKNHKEYI